MEMVRELMVSLLQDPQVEVREMVRPTATLGPGLGHGME